MRAAPIRVGIVGANAHRGWARDAHLPAIRRLEDLELVAVSARTRALADSAAEAFGARAAFDDSIAMTQHADIDLVVVTVKVPEHRAVVLSALDAGKAVYCEWPLGVDLDEACEMASRAELRTHAMVGLQGLFAPALRQARELLASGVLGAPRILRVFSSAAAWGPTTTTQGSYLQKRRNGATLETIGGGHTLAAIESLVGAYVEVDARNTTITPHVQIEDAPGTVERTCADHMFVLGRHDTGCVSSLEVIGGMPDRPALFDLVCDRGWLRVTGERPGTYQIPRLILESSAAFPAQAHPAVTGLEGPPVNIAAAYQALIADMRSGTRLVPDFDRATRLTRLLKAIDLASATGLRQRLQQPA